MPRVLTASRCTVDADHVAEYLTVVAALAERCRARGQRVWVFRHGATPDRFIEFTEAPTEMAHRVQASRTSDELRLERRLRELARYDQDAWDLYTETPLANREPRKHGETHD